MFTETINNLSVKNKNYFYFTMYGLFSQLVMTFYKQFGLKLISRLGGNNFHITLYTSLPGLFVMLTLFPFLFFINKNHCIQKVTSYFILITRSFLLLPIFLIPIVPSQYRAITFVIIISLLRVTEEITIASVQSFTRDVFKEKNVSIAISIRTKFSRLITPFIILLAGYILNDLPKSETETFFYYKILFFICFLIGLLEFYFFRSLTPLNDNHIKKPLNFNGSLKEISNDKVFLKYFITTLCFYFAWQSGWPLVAIYQLDVLNTNEFWLSLSLISGGLVAFFSTTLWSNSIQKIGSINTLIFAIIAMSINTILISLSPNLIVLTLFAGFSGFSTSGIAISLTDSLIKHTPKGNRVIYIGLYNTCINFTLAISPIFSYFILKLTSPSTALQINSLMRFVSALILFIAYREKDKIKRKV